MLKFIVLTTQRTGSSWLIDLLANHPEIDAFGEVFINRVPNRENPWVKGLMPEVSYFEYKQQNPNRKFPVSGYLRYLRDRVFKNKCNGFKMMYNQIAMNKEFLIPLILGQYRIVHLIRRNLLDMVISRSDMNKKGMTHLVDGDKKEIEKVWVDPEMAFNEMRKIEKNVHRMQRVLSFLPVKVLEVYYEDLCTDKEGTLKSIFEFLGVDSQALRTESRFRKIHTVPKNEMIENFDALKDKLSSTPYREFLQY